MAVDTVDAQPVGDVAGRLIVGQRLDWADASGDADAIAGQSLAQPSESPPAHDETSEQCRTLSTRSTFGGPRSERTPKSRASRWAPCTHSRDWSTHGSLWSPRTTTTSPFPSPSPPQRRTRPSTISKCFASAACSTSHAHAPVTSSSSHHREHPATSYQSDNRETWLATTLRCGRVGGHASAPRDACTPPSWTGWLMRSTPSTPKTRPWALAAARHPTNVTTGSQPDPVGAQNMVVRADQA